MRYCLCIEKVNKFEKNEIEFVFLATCIIQKKKIFSNTNFERLKTHLSHLFSTNISYPIKLNGTKLVV